MVVLIIVRPAGIVPRSFGPEKLIRGLFGK